jgi:hypothetical protein
MRTPELYEQRSFAQLLNGLCNVPAHTKHIIMIERAKKNWQEFKDSEPGERFQDRYNRRQQEEHGRWSKGTIFNIVLGLLIIAGGLLIGLVPGPGGFIAFLGLGLIGSEFQPTAKALDWGEVKVRAVVSWAKNIWAVLPLGGKIIVGALTLVVVAMAAYGGYVLVFGGSS